MKTDLRRAESYMPSPDWIAQTGATINQKNEKDNKCFQYLIISALKKIFEKNRKI